MYIFLQNLKNWCNLAGMMVENKKVDVVLYVLWLFNSKSESTDRQDFDQEDGNFRLSMSEDGKISCIDVQEKVKFQLQMFQILPLPVKNSMLS